MLFETAAKRGALTELIERLAENRPTLLEQLEQKPSKSTIDDLRKKISEKTRGIVIINPNNPCGALYEQKVVKQIVELAETARRDGLLGHRRAVACLPPKHAGYYMEILGLRGYTNRTETSPIVLNAAQA